MAKLKMPKIPTVNSSQIKSWTFVVIAGVVLAVLALIDSGGLRSTAADGSSGCVVEVSTQVNVRSAPSQTSTQVGTLQAGEKVDATAVVTDGFRQLEDARWVSDQYLTPVPGTTCS